MKKIVAGMSITEVKEINQLPHVCFLLYVYRFIAMFSIINKFDFPIFI